MAKNRSRKKIISVRIAAYANSPHLRQRMMAGNELFCTIDGNYGVYHTHITLARSRIKEAECTCPSEYWPCKHAEAILITYKEDPKSFIDVNKLLIGLHHKSKKDLLKSLRQMILIAPTSLVALGFDEFNEKFDEEMDDEWQ